MLADNRLSLFDMPYDEGPEFGDIVRSRGVIRIPQTLDRKREHLEGPVAVRAAAHGHERGGDVIVFVSKAESPAAGRREVGEIKLFARMVERRHDGERYPRGGIFRDVLRRAQSYGIERTGIGRQTLLEMTSQLRPALESIVSRQRVLSLVQHHAGGQYLLVVGFAESPQKAQD